MAKRTFTQYPSSYVKASTSYNYITPEQAKIIDKIMSSNQTIAKALIYAYERNALTHSTQFCAGEVEGIAFAIWQMGVINFDEYSILTKD